MASETAQPATPTLDPARGHDRRPVGSLCVVGSAVLRVAGHTYAALTQRYSHCVTQPTR